MTEDDRDLIADFERLVNMTPKELERWLASDESKNAGQSDEGGETKGHESGRRILALLRKNRSEYSNDDLAHMRRVRGYVKRHLAQRPSGDPVDTTWRYSLMNWGHDPTR
ncbi:DUF3140 domain-containing protein [Saccharopolyspora aridisoli]|uniref:DUF3140 domain-containing protein n=1 Tax=Saccharopolyspora aridisoli TaxID=2530385 RepID=A0A4V2Y826_9PSEU|nr:DUF3140 domain-containing protein [Saccharopolyspora aridisoli]TDC94355.1 DUF3140 domain-containing protein [Saccharopolyspora aridisoli]